MSKITYEIDIASKQNKVWNKNFTLLTIGSFISMMGSYMASLAISFTVFDMTKSVFLFAMFNVAYYIPKLVVTPLLGPIIDKYSRKKIVIGTDCCYCLLFFLLPVIIYFTEFSLPLYLGFNFLISLLDSVYSAAFTTLLPDTITPGRSQKSYSIDSLLGPISQGLMAPIFLIVYNKIGLSGILIFNSITYLIVAIFECFIDVKENLIKDSKSTFLENLKEGYVYLREEKGIYVIYMKIFFTTVTWGAIMTVMLPYFESKVDLGKDKYIILGIVMTGSRFIIGFLQSIFVTYSSENKFKIYVIINFIIDSLLLFIFISPLYGIYVIWGITGSLGIITITIRTSSLMAYIPGNMRGRLSSISLVLSNMGMLLGSFLGGFIAEKLGYITLGTLVGVLGLIVNVYYFSRYKKSLFLVFRKDL
ncbi:MFS transporter [Fusobacteria bacterium ZRK30]|nr:MFS transporter [Fusobacteria bacterium ZRK30]